MNELTSLTGSEEKNQSFDKRNFAPLSIKSIACDLVIEDLRIFSGYGVKEPVILSTLTFFKIIMFLSTPQNALDQHDFRTQKGSTEKHWAQNVEDNPLASILTIEINTTELCNRSCVFCPRHNPNVYPNRNLHLSVKGAAIIAEELAQNDYAGKVFSGFSENLLNPNFVDIERVQAQVADGNP